MNSKKSDKSSEKSSNKGVATFDTPENYGKQAKPLNNADYKKRNSLPAAAFTRPSQYEQKIQYRSSVATDARKQSKAYTERRESQYRRDSRQISFSNYRRMSVWDRLNPNYVPTTKTSSTKSTRTPSVKYENSYVTDTPTGKQKFNSIQVESMMGEILESMLEGEKYDSTQCRHLSMLVSNTIKDRVKLLNYSTRYRYVCLVSIAEAEGQSLEVASRCLWSPEVDDEASATYSNSQLLAFATVFAVFME